jgi:hypothetical protein
LEAIMAVGEWDQRQLCPDGGCVGVIGPGGTCKVCGRAAQNWGDERKRGLIEPPDEEHEADQDAAASPAARPTEDGDEDDDLEDEDEDDDLEGEGDEDDEDEDDGDEGDQASGPAAARPAVAASSPPGEWTSRQLCPDGGCIGVIGAGGKCKVCGRSASSGQPDEPDAAAPAATTAAIEPAATNPASEPAATNPASEPAATNPANEPAAGPSASPGEPADPASTSAATAAGDRCIDTTCAGVSGPDGHCEVCGKAVAG